MSLLSQISDWKQFERLCADLLADEGFFVESEPFVDRSGSDIVAVEEYRSHDPSRVIRVRWRVQCKHLAKSGTNLGRKEVEEILISYAAVRGPNDGLLIMVSSDYTEAAKDAIDRHLSTRPLARVAIWNRRHLESLLDRHPQLLKRYDLIHLGTDFTAAFKELGGKSLPTVLLLSDQSILAHDLAHGMRRAGVEVVFLPFWNYNDPIRLELVLASFSQSAFGLVLCFLGDSFSIPMPQRLTEFVARLHGRGTPVMFFPFVAWSRAKRLYSAFDEICPVELLEAAAMSAPGYLEQILSDYRRGDFSWLLDFDAFAENRYVEYDPGDAEPPFKEGIESRFGLSHSFEYLRPTPSAKMVWKDTGGNPFVVVGESSSGKSCYVNTCCHACMSPIAVSSPLEVCPEFGLVLRNCLRWLME